MTLLNQGKPARITSHWNDADVTNQLYTIYTCPQNCRAEVSMLHIVNAGGNTTVDCYWFIHQDNIPESLSTHTDYSTWLTSGYRSRIVGGKNMATGEDILFVGGTLILEPGDRLEVKGVGTSTVHVDARCTVTETFIPVG